MTFVACGLSEEDSRRRSRSVGTICVAVTGESISTCGSRGCENASGMWKLPMLGLSYGVTLPSFGREMPLDGD